MADTERKEKKSGWRMVWEALQTVGAGAGILALQHAMEETLTGAGKKAGEVVGKKIGDAFGLNSEEAEKTDDDEISLRRVYLKGNMTPDEIKDAKNWLGRLRKENPKLANEYTKGIHNSVVKSVRQHEIDMGTKDKPKKKTITDDSDGIKIAVNLIRDILAESTDEKKLEVLERENIKVPTKKPTPEFVKKAKEAEKRNRGELEKISSDWRERAKKWREKK